MVRDEPAPSLVEIVAETRQLLRHLDDVPWPQMDMRFYMHGYDELHLALERLLEAVAQELDASY
ncbi:hypothetical protein BFN01_07240 [Microbacterium sp. AR7-10]|nr:hypothetical protein BFN01_07240 [Microbacterium sp. AR7-10]